MLPSMVSAQTTALATLSNPDLEEFPRVSAFLDVRDAQGYFISSLQADNVTVIEDGEQRFVAEITELRLGGHFVVALNPGDGFDVRDSQGVTRIELLTQALTAWVDAMAADPIDTLSLVTPIGTLSSHEEDANTWLAAWQSYQPDYNNTAPNLETLSQAVDLALDPTKEPGMGRAVLFITPVLPLESAEALQNIADRARQGQVRVYVVVIDGQDMLGSDYASQLQSLALQTGGQYVPYSGSEPLLEISALVESSRRVYRLVYNSHVKDAGVHAFNVVVQTAQGEIVSPQLEFEITLRPPNPIVVSPPAQILRAVPPEAELSLENLLPHEQTIEMVVDFPDTIQREIVHSTLYVNDVIVADNNAPPFEKFSFNLDQYEASELVMLKVEATDELGLTGASIETPVQITVQPPQRSLSSMLARNAPLVAGAAVVVAGLVFFLILVIVGRIRPLSRAERTRKRPVYLDPVTQPLSKLETGRNQKALGKANSIFARLTRTLPTPEVKWPLRQPKSEAIAYLVGIGDGEKTITGKVHAMSSQEITFGSDPRQAVIVIDDPAVEGLHACLWRDDEGLFHISDKNTIAGTWINYAPVSPDGCRVESGDLIHIAKTGFRFTCGKPANTVPPQVRKIGEGR
jgi:hypothetical protein